MIQKIIEENILDTSLSVCCHRLDGNSMDMYLKTSKYLFNCVQHISFLCQCWLSFLDQQIGLGRGEIENAEKLTKSIVLERWFLLGMQ